MRKLFIYSFALSIAMLNTVFPQFFSPGDLSSAHFKYLDGFSKCTKCHTGNRKKACLKCHTDIAEKIESKSGYHYRNDDKRCYQCHGEHRGKKHDLRDLKRIGFKHEDTGWPLEGKHKRLKCEECHTDKRVNAITGKKTNLTTYLKNSSQCSSCHPNPHKKPEYQKPCDECHNAQDWNYFDFAKDKKPKNVKKDKVQAK
ncbi:MAG TPA: hypothetical protein PKC21_03465 [Oligoflexia bacterium]|nr:hypothetical protein [Oligoflexia bacterium]HMR24394.1 hypothetical protein [Oligoflexia bacterium]